MSLEFKYNYPQIARDTGFTLRQFKDGPLDWRTVASLEIEKIIRDQQFEHIDSVLLYLSEAPIASMLESNILDSGIAKYFTLSQLAVQYLLFCRKFLDETVCTLRENINLIEAENSNLKTINREHSNEIILLHKKISQMEAISDIVYPCHMCTKNFVSNDALNMHLSKKHSNLVADGQSKDNDKSLISTIKLELEIKQLKERLNSAEKEIRENIVNGQRNKSPTYIMKTSSGTQVCAQIKDAATQSNLCETKENDDSEYYAKKETLCELQDNVAKLEHWQEKQFENNQNSIQNITQMLAEIMKVLQSKPNPEEKLAEEIISSSLPPTYSASTPAEEIKTILSKSVSEVIGLNSEKLNEIMLTIETICQEMLPSLKREIQKGREPRHEHVQNIRQIAKQTLFNFEEAPSNEMKHVKAIHEPTEEINFQEIQPEDDSTDVSQIEYNPLEHDTDTDKQKFKTEVPLEKIEAFDVRSTRKILEQNMLLLGLKPTEEALSLIEANKISNKLEEKRTSVKRVYPRFYATRNKLKNLVEELSNKKIEREPLRFQTTSKSRKNYYPESEDRSKQIMNNDVLRNKLEKILNSPVKSPKSYTKPIPLPRKRVMFNNVDKFSNS